MRKFLNRPIIYKILALLFAVGLYFYVHDNNLGISKNSAENSQVANTMRSASVPLELEFDSDKYFVTGYPEKVNINLDGPAAVVTVLLNNNNFKVFADLSSLGVGTHQVKLQQSGINNQITTKISPETITVNIQPRGAVTLPIQPSFNKASIASGYNIGIPQLSPDTVSVTGPQSEIAKISRIEAHLNLPPNVKETVEQQVMLQALDANGNQVNVVLNPETTHVQLPINLPSKEVNLKFNLKNPSDKLNYEVTSNNSKVKVFAPQAVLDGLDEVNVSVDVANVKDVTEQDLKIELPTGIMGVTPDTTHIKINPTNKES